MANNYDFSDSNTTFFPESAKGSLRDQIASQTDANMGRKRIYLNSEEWKEYQSFKNDEMFEKLLSGMSSEYQDVYREMYGKGEYISPDAPRSYDDIKWKQRLYAAEGEIRFANGYKLMVSKIPQEEGIKVLKVVNRKTFEELPLDVIRGVSEAGFKPQHNYSIDQIDQLISLVQKIKGSYYPEKQEKNSEKSGIPPLMQNQASVSPTKPNLYDKISDISRMQPNDLLKVDDLYISFFERRRNSETINKYNEENKVENNTSDFYALKWGKEITLAPIQAKDGSITYTCHETATIPLENGNTISIVKKENGTYSYLTKDKNNNVTSSSHNMPKEEVAYLLKLNANDIKNKQENISSNTPSHVYPNLENFDTIKLNDRIKIRGISASGELASQEEMIYKQSLIDKYNKENIVENHTDDFSKIKWGKKLVYDREQQAFDASSTYVCVESADFPLVGGLTINITKQGNGYIYSLLDNDKEAINSFYTEDIQALSDKLKANGLLIKKENEIYEQSVIDAGKKKITGEAISIQLERIRHKQQELSAEKEGIAPKTDDAKKFAPTTINKETVDAYVAKNLKQNH